MNSQRSGGFSLVELLLIIAVVGTITSVSYVSISNSRSSAEQIKLESDVSSINQSVQLYRANGGSLNGVTAAADVIAKLQTHSDSASSVQRIGMNSNFLDRRVKARMQTAAETSSSAPRAVWSSTEQQFSIVTSGGNGVKEFYFDEDIGAAVADSGRTVMKASQDGGWVWEYSEAAPVASNTGASPGINVAPPSGLTGSPDLPFTNAWTITDPLGRVDVSDIYRQAGYASRLALVSLEGMEAYDLTTDAGRLAFMTELVRRAAEGDRAQTIIDRSTSSTGNGVQTFQQTYYFRPGDTVAAVVIPNGSFQNTYDRLLAGTTNSQTFPLTSLNLGTTSPPFYADQLASLGNDGYALEDLVADGKSDLDYDDIIFKATGLGQAENSTTREIDPRTYYPTRLQQLGRSGDWGALETALENAGIMPPN